MAIIFPQPLIDAAQNRQLVLFVGAGLSCVNGLPNWSGLAYRALQQLAKTQKISYSELSLLGTYPPRTQVSIAQIIAGGSQQKIDYKDALKGEVKSKLHDSLWQISRRFVTTNYDSLIEANFRPFNDGNGKTIAMPTSLNNPPAFSEENLSTEGSVFHIHGSLENEDDMVLSTWNYLTHY